MMPLTRIERAIAALASLCVTLVLLLGVVSLSVTPEQRATELAKAPGTVPLRTP